MGHLETLNLFVRRWFRRFLLEVLFWGIATLIAIVTGSQWRVWRRNSLVLDYWDKQSDLDLTLYSTTQKQLPKSVLVLWRLCRRFGEWAAFSSEDRRWVSVANPLELARDPRLMAEMGAPSRMPTRPEAFVFWLRMVGLNSGSMQIDFSKILVRSRKWSFHRSQLHKAVGLTVNSPFPDYVEEMGEALAPIPKSDWLEQKSFLLPHQWLGEVRSSDVPAVEPLVSSVPDLNQVARAQVQWEVWGLLSQIRLENNRVAIEEHLLNLAKIFPETDDMHVMLKSFIEYLNQINDGHVSG